MGKKSGPSAPDPAATAAAQGAANKEAVYESARVNQINESSPFGTTSYSGEIGSPNRTKTTTLSPAEQQKLAQQNELAGILGGSAIRTANEMPQGPFNYEGISNVPTDYSQTRQAATDKVYQGLTKNLDRDFGRSEEGLRSKLAAQGISQDSEAFKRELEAFNDSKNTALNNAALSAYNTGASEQTNQYNQDVANRTRAISERQLLRSVPQNELSAILQGSPAINAPNIPQTGQYGVNAPDVAGMIQNNYNAQLNQANQRSSKMGGTLGNLINAGATIYAASSPAFKENNAPLQESVLDKLVELPIEQWSYKSDFAKKHLPTDNGVTHIGCYADDFQRLFGVGDGVTINLVDAFGVIMQSIKEIAAKVAKLEAKND